MRKIIINTLAFINDMQKNGKRQVAYVQQISRLGADGVEVRREMFADVMQEVPEIKRLAKEYDLAIFYSIPGALYKDGVLDKNFLETVAQEAKELGAVRAKFNVGECHAVTQDDLHWLDATFAANDIQITVENDQTQQNGRIQILEHFAQMCREAKAQNIDLTFDVGNWIYVGVDPMQAAAALKNEIGYVHLKDVKKGEHLVTCRLGEGDVAWQALVKQFSPEVPVAIEYPCGEEPFSVLEAEMKKLENAL